MCTEPKFLLSQTHIVVGESDNNMNKNICNIRISAAEKEGEEASIWGGRLQFSQGGQESPS